VAVLRLEGEDVFDYKGIRIPGADKLFVFRITARKKQKAQNVEKDYSIVHRINLQQITKIYLWPQMRSLPKYIAPFSSDGVVVNNYAIILYSTESDMLNMRVARSNQFAGLPVRFKCHVNILLRNLQLYAY